MCCQLKPECSFPPSLPSSLLRLVTRYGAATSFSCINVFGRCPGGMAPRRAGLGRTAMCGLCPGILWESRFKGQEKRVSASLLSWWERQSSSVLAEAGPTCETEVALAGFSTSYYELVGSSSPFNDAAAVGNATVLRVGTPSSLPQPAPCQFPSVCFLPSFLSSAFQRPFFGF